MPEPFSEDLELSITESDESPLHGYRGERQPAPTVGIPAGLTIAISREAGSRGASIARRAGEKLGWEVYSQELLEFIAQDASVREDLLARLPARAGLWVEQQLDQLLHDPSLSRGATIPDLARLVLSLGAQGNVILLGRGAGYILPAASTLHVRLVAPLADRIAYMSQWLRLTDDEAADQVRKRDQRRSEFLASHFRRKSNDVHAYDMVLNSSLLGEERCADLIAAAAKAKMCAVVGMD